MATAQEIWNKAHETYKEEAAKARRQYRALITEAKNLGWCSFSFNELVKNEIDKDVAGNDPWEWVRAGKFAIDFRVRSFGPDQYGPFEFEPYQDLEPEGAIKDSATNSDCDHLIRAAWDQINDWQRGDYGKEF